jgi:diaminopimelate decarboxylase
VINIKENAHWAFRNAATNSLISKDDSALIFQSWDDLKFNLNQLRSIFDHANAIHAIAIKTNPHPSVLAKIISWGFGLEAASMEEVEMAIKAGATPNKIVFDSPVKRRSEIEKCNNELRGLILNVNSLEELKRIPDNPNFTLGIRINPSMEMDSPEIYSVSNNESKFGVPIIEKEALLNVILSHPIQQLHIHAASQMKDLTKAVFAVRELLDLAIEANILLEKKGIERRILTLDIGGGLAAEKYGNVEKMSEYVKMLKETCPELWDFELITEFGQWCHTNSGFIFSEIEYTFKRGNKQIAFIHLGADYFMRDAYTVARDFDIIALNNEGEENNSDEKYLHDIAGPLCFAGDYVLKGVKLPILNEHDWLGILGTGANTLGLWSRHCSRTLPKVIGFSRENKLIEILSERINPFL